MSDLSFTWRGVNSDQHGVVVRSLPPIYAPQVRDEPIPIPGRHGSLHQQDGAYEEQLMMVEGYLPYEQEGAAVSPIETIKAWLHGDGLLTLSDQPERAYRARITDAIAFSAWVQGFADRLFAVSFWCDPLAYEASPDPPERVLAPRTFTTLDNPGTAPADPLIVVRGSGTVRITVGDRSVTLNGLAGEVAIDSEIKSAYKGTVDYPTVITLDDGEWPVLGLGDTRVSWTGSVQQVEITPRWRWL